MKGVIGQRFETVRRGVFFGLVVAATAAAIPGGAAAESDTDGEKIENPVILQWMGYQKYKTSRISDDKVTIVDPDTVPDRPARLELGNAFVGTGPISKGFELPTGQVWTPSLLIWGNHRTALQVFNTGAVNPYFNTNTGNTNPDGRPGRSLLNHTAEWANRLDIYANLLLSGTERVLVGFRPLDEGFFGPNPATGRFTGYYFNDAGPNPDSGDFKKEFNSDLITLFYEMDFGEMFPRLDPEDKYPLDISITVGRQQFFYQEGILVFDFFDGLGITKNSIRLPGTSNLQVSFLWGWNEINRGDNLEVKVLPNPALGGVAFPTSKQRDLDLFGLFFAVDHPWTTVNLDLIFIKDHDELEDGFYGGLSFVQRIGHYSTAFRVVASVDTHKKAPRIGGTAPTSAVDDGVVFFFEGGYTPAYTRNNIYATFFFAINDFTPAARMPGTGGPMGRAGVGFAGQGLGRYAAPIANFAQDAVGGAIGYQFILDGELARRQLIFEIGGRADTSNLIASNTAAILTRYQQAIGQHWLLQFDLMGRVQEDRSPGYGARVELRTNF